uniref:Uncharacterized protein LOC108045983 n=1 Tax=Drosophila rhopaloa TaxID=1041015 RepID=A0A6P4EW76_DRORH
MLMSFNADTVKLAGYLKTNYKYVIFAPKQTAARPFGSAPETRRRCGGTVQVRIRLPDKWTQSRPLRDVGQEVLGFGERRSSTADCGGADILVDKRDNPGG